jgi:NADH-quinone oxidoreductase subunit L
LNLPEILPGAGWLEHRLEPLTETAALYLPEGSLAPGAEWGLLFLATVVAALGLVGAWRLLQPERLVPAHEAPAEVGWARVLNRKYYVDEIYDAAIVRPLIWLSDRVLWKTVDQGIIDGAGVNGVARFSRFIGWLGSRMQSGSVGAYVLMFVVGVLLVLYGVRS